MQLTYSVGASVLATLASVGVVAFAWRRRETPGAVPLAAFTAATALWTGGNALQIASTTLSAKLFWVNVQYVGAGVVPLAWFAFACEYADREEWVTPRIIAALAVVPVVTLVLAWTNGSHHLVRQSSELVTVGGAVEIRRTFGPWFWFANAYSNIVLGSGTVVFLHGLVRSRRLYRLQTLAVLTGATVPGVAATLFYNGLSPIEPEVFFGVSALAFAFAISRYGLLDVVPVGRSTVVEEMDDPVVVLGDGDRIVDANPAATDLFGWPGVDSAVGRPIADACASCPELLRQYAAGDAAGELAVEDPDGETRHFDVRLTALPDRAANARILLLRDVTALKLHEEHLEQQNERLERVGHTIAHDLRNPLNVAQGHLELVRDDGADVDDHLDKVESAHRRMTDIIDEVLAVARNDRHGRRDRHALRRVAERAWRNVDTADADLVIEADAESVEADDSQLASAFENLFRNAVEHGSTSSHASRDDVAERSSAARETQSHDAVEHGGPNVTVRVGALDGHGSDELAGFYVEDDGPGIPESERERVFDHGFTTRNDGTGVGLAVVEDVAERHGWRVAVTESEGGGARFEFRFTDVAREVPESS